MVNTVALKKEGPGFCVEFACSACACVGFLQVLWFTPPSKHAHYIDSVSALDQGEIWSWSLDAIVAHCSLRMG